MRRLTWEDLAKMKGAKFTTLRDAPRPAMHFVEKKKAEKIIVPPRAERYEEMGDPKAPKMGKITPAKIEIPEVDDLLEKMKKVTAPLEFSQCHVNCRCLPCLQGACDGCHVERHRDNPDRALVQQLVAQYRG